MLVWPMCAIVGGLADCTGSKGDALPSAFTSACPFRPRADLFLAQDGLIIEINNRCNK